MENNEQLNDFEATIQRYLEKFADNDALFGLKYEKGVQDGKTITSCCNWIIDQVRESGRNGFSDAEIFGMAVHYYDEEELKADGSRKDGCKVVVNRTIELTEEQKAKLRQEALEEYKAKVIAEAREKDAKARAARVKKVAEDAPADGMLDLFGE